jgi:hypothetical protein
MSTIQTYTTCYYCLGTGEILGERSLAGDDVCQQCSGTGKMKLRWLDYGENIFPSYQILECLDSTEYAALTAANKTTVLVVLSCGFVDLNAGKAGRVRLVNAFGAGSTTVASLTALLE